MSGLNKHVFPSCVWILIGLWGLVLTSSLRAAELSTESNEATEASEGAENEYIDMPLEKLMKVEVVSASRQTQPLEWSSVPISVITAEDIHYSGLTTLPEILRLACGVDVIRFDRNRYGVGVRGMHGIFSDRTLVLVNGRPSGDFVYGRIQWLDIPVFVEDIERIEVARGPTGSAWGANAFTGMINIITKKPKEVLGCFGTTTFNDFGDSYSQVRWAAEKDKWSWRFSAGYENFEDSDAAGAGKYESAVPALNELMGFDRFTANDFSRNWRFDTEAIYQHSDQTKLSFGAGYGYNEMGSGEFIGHYVDDHRLNSSTRLFTRLDHTFEDGSSGYLQWFDNIFVTHNPPMEKRYSFQEQDLESQYNFKLGERHEVTVGGNVRWAHITTKDTFASSWPNAPLDEYWVGAFLLDRFALHKRLTFENQIRYDWFSETHCDWSWRSSALYGLDDAKQHILRISTAKAFRTPSAVIQENIARAPGGFLELDMPTEAIRNEETWSLEAGYSGRLTEKVILRVNGYYQRFDHLIHLSTSQTTWDNLDGGDGYGSEVELAWEDTWGKLSTWYAYNDFHTDQYDQGIRSYYPAYHKVGVTGRLFLPGGWTLNTNYVYNDAGILPAFDLQRTDVLHRLDLTLAKSFLDDKGEVMLGVFDVLNDNHSVIWPNGQFTNYETPGRSFFARVQFKF